MSVVTAADVTKLSSAVVLLTTVVVSVLLVDTNEIPPSLVANDVSADVTGRLVLEVDDWWDINPSDVQSVAAVVASAYAHHFLLNFTCGM